MSELSNAARVDLERMIVLGLIRSLRSAGWVPFRTFDGEAWVYPHDEAGAMKAVFDLDEVSLRFVPADVHAKYLAAMQLVASNAPGGLPSGSVRWARRRAKAACEAAEHGVLLVLGNGEDVISDWNYSEGDADGFNAAMDAYAYDKGSETVVSRASRLAAGAAL